MPIRNRTNLQTLFAAALAALCVLGLSASAAAAGPGRRLPVYCVQREDKKVALTFDAAWGNEDTGELIRILGERGAPATFFVVGKWAEKYPDSVRQLHEAGHDVMNHSATHPHCTRISRAELVQELESCNDAVSAVTGVRPTLFRPPFGDYDDRVVETVESLGMTAIQWDVEPYHIAEIPSRERVLLL